MKMRNAYIQRDADLLEQKWKLESEALEIFKLVVSEWESDPMSVQCFDLRIVEKAKYVRELLADNAKKMEKHGGFL